jgi:hypothetical protein
MAQKRNSETGVASVDLPVQIWLALSASVPRFASADPQALGSLDWRKLTPIRKLKGGKWSLIVLSDHDDLDDWLAWKEERTVSTNVMLHYDKVILILHPNAERHKEMDMG